jgi:hypothetical protein
VQNILVCDFLSNRRKIRIYIYLLPRPQKHHIRKINQKSMKMGWRPWNHWDRKEGRFKPLKLLSPGAGGMAQAVEHLSSNPSTAKKPKPFESCKCCICQK